MLVYRIAEDLACAVVAIGLWEVGHRIWGEWAGRRIMRRQGWDEKLWATLRRRIAEVDEMSYCPPAADYDPLVPPDYSDYDGEDYIS